MQRTPTEDLLKQTNLTKPDLETLTRLFNAVAQSDKIDRARFRDMLADVFGVNDSLIMDRGCELLMQCLDALISMLIISLGMRSM